MSVRKDEVPDDDTTQERNEYQDKSTVEEGEAASFVVELSGAVVSEVAVSYATSNATAEAGTNEAGDNKDYRAANGVLTFTSDGALAKTIAVATTDDDLNEATENFNVTLTAANLPDQVSIGTATAKGTITDNDALTAAVTPVETSVDEGKTAEFAVTLTGGTSTADVLVAYSLDDGRRRLGDSG